MPRAPKQTLTQAEVRKLISNHALDEHKDLILKGLRKSVRLKAGEPVKRRLPVGTSKFGGEPDLSADTEWPTFNDRPLHFLAQLNLVDLPPRHIPTADLPRKGLLSFWYDTQGDRTWGARDIYSMRRYRVLYHTRQGTRRPFPEFDGQDLDEDHDFFFWRPFPERRVSLEPMWTLDEGVQKRFFDIAMNDGIEFLHHHTEFVQALEIGGHGMHSRLLGSFWDLHDGREDAAGHAARARKKKPKKRDHEQWRLLALFDSDRDVDEWTWGDEGQLGFWIRKEDLNGRQFDRVCGGLLGC